jgi:thiamine biosynthesis protein ThiI
LKKVFVAHYSEISLRGANRGWYVKMLMDNIESMLQGAASNLSHIDARIIGELGDAEWPTVDSRLSKVFGVAWYTRALLVAHDYDELKEVCIELARRAEASGAHTFGIRVRRAGDYWGGSSLDIARKLGEDVRLATGLKVDLEEPALTLFVDVVRTGVLVYTFRRLGPGGLPFGSSGSVVHLLSGGVDSAVAAWQLMKRGVNPLYLHFYAYPSLEDVLDSKVARVALSLAEYSGTATLVATPFTKYQLTTLNVRERVEPVLFRFFMRRFAENIAVKINAKGVSFGDSLGQVASQTLDNIAAVDQDARLPVLRPLLTFNKQETVDLAKRLGLYEHTIQPYKDCCSIVSGRPNMRVSHSKLREVYEAAGLEDLIGKLEHESHVVLLEPGKNSRVVPLLEWIDTQRQTR